MEEGSKGKGKERERERTKKGLFSRSFVEYFVFILACHFSKMVSPLGFLAFGLVENSSWHEPWMLEILLDIRF
ncbi:hypothetical protein RclHR1_08780001 [Rhizophagus clarus]|uniref:Uncharacterized protein n=1 Tax=Rhizophagus clarus TaxID=94130 RepID=A0A2Z6SG31_9GLOM|nr:hypothetical protein RclHR1_08780001 [Rhizophagus clarus]